MMCCRHLTAHHCMAKLLPQIQLFGPWISTFVIFVLLVVFTRGSPKPKFDFGEDVSAVGKAIEMFFEDYSFSGWLFMIAMILTLLSSITGISLVYFLSPSSPHVQLYGDSFGIIAVVLLFIQYIPQIYTTHKHREWLIEYYFFAHSGTGCTCCCVFSGNYQSFFLDNMGTLFVHGVTTNGSDLSMSFLLFNRQS